MSDEVNGRRVRPEPDRTGPDRTFAAPLRARAERGETAEASAQSAASAASSSTTTGPQAAGTARESEPSAQRTLNDAYRLVDEYLRQGQRMAEDLWLPLNGPRDGRASFGPAGRFMRAMSDMTLAWVEVMQAFTTAVEAPERRAPAGSAGPFGQPPAPSAAPGVAARQASSPPVTSQKLAVSVEAQGRVEASVQIAEAGGGFALVPTELRAFSTEAEPIRGVSFEAMPGESPRLRIVVPPGQPPGTYNGFLLDVQSRPRGTVSLIVH
jgi:hypothetical protein